MTSMRSHYIIALLSSTAFLLLLPSTIDVFVVSGELQPLSLLPQHPRPSRRTSPPTSSIAFLSRKVNEENFHEVKRHRGRRSQRHDENFSSLALLNHLRCGGTDESVGETSTDETGTIDGSSKSEQQQQPPSAVVDISVVESEGDSTLSNNSNNCADESFDTEAANEPESDLNNNNDAQKEESVTDGSNEGKAIIDSDVITDESKSDDELDSSNESQEGTGDDNEGGISSMECVESSTSSQEEDEDITTAEELLEKQTQLRSSASDKRAEGKSLHDAGSLNEAAMAFREAASLLDEALEVYSSSELVDPSSSDTEENANNNNNAIAIERATCRLHEALCLLKDGRPGDCVMACTDVLEDGVTVVPLETTETDVNDENIGEDAVSSDDITSDAKDDGDDVTTTKSAAHTTTAVVKIIPPPVEHQSTTTPLSTTYKQSIPPQIRARAHHRRAKARLALGDLDGALEDARSAAFMGDRNAVQFYGRLMREGGDSSSSMGRQGGLGGASSLFGLSDTDSSTGGGSSNPFLEGILEGMTSGGKNNNPLIPSSSSSSSGTGSNDFSSSLLSSLLTSGTSGGSGGNPLGLMGELLSPPSQEVETKGKSGRRRRRGGKKKQQGMDGLAKSVLTNVMKRVEDEETQQTICKYLQSTNTQQIMSFASMAGLPLKEENARRLVTLANGVTPRGISKSISRVKRGISIVKTVRKILKVIDKYKAFIILAILCYWIRSAIVEPYPVSGKKQQANKLMQKAALSILIMPSSSCRVTSRSFGSLCGGIAKALCIRHMSDSNDNMTEGSAKSGIEEELERLKTSAATI